LLYFGHPIGELHAALRGLAFRVEILPGDVLYEVLSTLLVLKISFAVQIFSFNIGDTLRGGAVQEDQISREKTVLHDLDDHPYMKVAPDDFLELASIRICHEHFPVILLIVTLVSFKVFENIFDHGY
jgi:hypothetical protein